MKPDAPLWGEELINYLVIIKFIGDSRSISGQPCYQEIGMVFNLAEIAKTSIPMSFCILRSGKAIIMGRTETVPAKA